MVVIRDCHFMSSHNVLRLPVSVVDATVQYALVALLVKVLAFIFTIWGVCCGAEVLALSWSEHVGVV